MLFEELIDFLVEVFCFFVNGMAEIFGHRHIKREELDATAWRIWTDRMGTLLLLDDEDPAE